MRGQKSEVRGQWSIAGRMLALARRWRLCSHCVAAILVGLGSQSAARGEAPPRQDTAKQTQSNAEASAGDSKQKPADEARPVSEAREEQLTSINLAAQLLGNLSPEHMKQFGQMLEQDWKRRPEWGDMAVAVLKGEAMRPGMGWWRPSYRRFDFTWLRAQFDADTDGAVVRAELPELAKADQLFARLDRDLDGRVTATDLEAVEPAGPANMMASYVFYQLDKDSNGRVTIDEVAGFFANADGEDLGFLTPEDLRVALDDPESRKPATRAPSSGPTPADMLRMFLTGQMGWLEAGPELGDLAPDFTLPTHHGSSTETLSASRGKKPVVLIFGSFT